MMQFGKFGVLLMVVMTAGCDQRRTDCEMLVGSMHALGKRLALAQRETASKDTSAQRVAETLRLFAAEATSTGETLAASVPTAPELKKIAADASSAALSLADSANRMVVAAERIKELDTARSAVRTQTSLANVAETNIKRMCASRSTQCATLSKVLLSRPAFPDPKASAETAQFWSERMTHWVDQLLAVELEDPELKHQVANLGQTARAIASASSTLSAAVVAEGELAAAARQFDSRIESAGAALTSARDFCQGLAQP